MKLLAKGLAVLTLVFSMVSGASADGGERGIAPIDNGGTIIVQPLDGGERG
ncbi:hypothetical protein [Brevibacillus centrosporus]|uniref:hypothetical protein n=1 Tax=Brevibacillus centrosporus TaxID=54910 RepID=UPI002E208FFA|nr:hypothetical protein [Brevibacillus centrosporus]